MLYSRTPRFYNLQVAVKGQVRTAPTAVTWVNSLLELAKTGDKDLQGTLKFLTVKNLLDLPAECRNAIFACINKLGWSGFLHCMFLMNLK